MHSGIDSWPLPSGVWHHDVGSDQWTLQQTAQGRACAASVAAADRALLAGASSAPGNPQRVFPPEFRFAPDSGEPLVVAALPQREPWCAPFGAGAAVADAVQARGLQRTGVALALRDAGASTDDAPHSLPLPPPGAYEFVVGRAGTAQDTLLALEPDHGSLLAWLPRSGTWLRLGAPHGGLLAESPLPRERWGLELVQTGALTRLFLPTAAGIAVVEPEVLGAGFNLRVVGEGIAVGAPLAWAGEVWAPCRRADGTLEIFSVTFAGQSGQGLKPALPPSLPAEGFAAPVSTPRQLIWPCRDGQLALRRNSAGLPEAAWLPWPAGMHAEFEFGCPYLSSTGALWQLCFDDTSRSYVYVQMGRTHPEVQGVSSPRFCTGMQSYKLGQRLGGEPWLEPEHAFDASSHEVVVPLLESAHDDAVLGLVIEAESGVGELMRSRERKRAVLQLQSDARSDARFFTLTAARPWRSRAFVYDGCLWLFHPDAGRIGGWALA